MVRSSQRDALVWTAYVRVAVYHVRGCPVSDRHLTAPPSDRPGVDPHATDPAWQIMHGAENDPQRAFSQLWHFQRRHHHQGGVPGGIQPHTYVGPFGRGLHKVEDPEGRQAIVPGPQSTFAPGQAVVVGVMGEGKVLLSHPPESRAGESKFTKSRDSGTLDTLSVTAADPDTLTRGTVTNVTLTGVNFEDGDLIRAMEFDDDPASLTFGEWVEDDEVSTSNVVHVDSETKTVDVTLDAATPLDHEYRLQVRRSDAS